MRKHDALEMYRIYETYTLEMFLYVNILNLAIYEKRFKNIAFTIEPCFEITAGFLLYFYSEEYLLFLYLA